MMVVSGVAAVSAYEAHVINVTAHIENALDVDTSAIEYGTVFPEEWLIRGREITLSESANTAVVGGDVTSVSYQVWAEWKVDPGNPNHEPDVIINMGGVDIDHYAWLGHWLWVGIDPADPTPQDQALPAGWVNVGGAPTFANYAKPVTGVSGVLTDDTPDTLKVMLLAPVFHTYYNSYTDVKPDWWPLDVWAANQLPAQWADGWDGGVDLKIQVTGIARP
jgi:hypothetical protein